ncbi:hypothetical protein, partial [Prescottella equi]|uniref:hypothetical protein n=1 Tax=Rhodococcus hoagii TaxID=43767 RepID=UPI001C92C19F
VVWEMRRNGLGGLGSLLGVGRGGNGEGRMRSWVGWISGWVRVGWLWRFWREVVEMYEREGRRGKEIYGSNEGYWEKSYVDG